MSDELHPNHPDYVRHDQRTGEVDEDVTGVQILDPISIGSLATLQRVEIDQQVATAKAYPRNVSKLKQELTALVTMDEETADDCIYALPRGQKHIKGPSARFADALINFWGNARSGAFITQVNREEKFVEAIGSFQDVERNVIRQRRVRRPISGRDGRIYNADMINMTGNAACVIAERNAILNGIPKSFWSGAYDQAFALVAGTTKTLGEKLERATKAFALQGISMEQVLAKLERTDVSKIVPDDIVTMRGMLTALKDGTETPETIFGRGAGHQHETMGNVLKDDVAESGGKAAATQAQPVKTAAVDSGGKADPISSGLDKPSAELGLGLHVGERTASGPRGSTRPLEAANTVIEKDGTVSKARNGEIEGPILDLRFAAGKQAFATAEAWLEAAGNMPEPEFIDQKGPETASNESGKTDMASPAAGKASGEATGSTSTADQPAGKIAQTASPGPAKNETVDETPYDDASGYMAFMRDRFDQAKAKGAKAAVTELWGATRADRNELLSPEQIDELTKDKEATLRGIKLKEGK